LAERTLARKPSSLMQLVYRESTNNNSTSMNEENDSGEDDESGSFFYIKDERKKVSSPLLAPLVRNCSRNFNFFNISFPC
jgi:hypothetical protein